MFFFVWLPLVGEIKLIIKMHDRKMLDV